MFCQKNLNFNALFFYFKKGDEIIFRKRKLEKELHEALNGWNDVDKYAKFQQEELEIKNKEIKKLKSEKIDDQLKKNDEMINDLEKQFIKKENELKDKLNKYEKKISDLKERLFEIYSDWHFEAGLAWRYHPTTKKIEKYKVPKNFDIDNINNSDFNEETQMIKFSYKENKNSGFGNSFEIPISLYTQIGGKLFSPNKNDINNNITVDDLKKKIVEKGGSIQSKYIDTIIQYCIDNDELFTAKEFTKKCKIKSRQSGNYYIKKFIKWDIIEKVKKNVYKCKKL